jgi:hypothetical protein
MIRCFLITLLLIGPIQGVFPQLKVELGYNPAWEITKPDRAAFYRIAEYDPQYLDLNGKVADYDSAGNLIMEGTYLNGNRSGEFVFYHPNGKVAIRGEFLADSRIDEWKWFDPEARLVKRILFAYKGNNPGFMELDSLFLVSQDNSTEMLKRWQPLDQYTDNHESKFKRTIDFVMDSTFWPLNLLYADLATRFRAATGIDTVPLDRRARYKFGDKALFNRLQNVGRYPSDQLGLNGGPAGRVFVSAVIDTTGIVTEIFVLRGMQKSFNQEALRQISFLKDWYPAIRNGLPVVDTVTIPIRFQAIVR